VKAEMMTFDFRPPAEEQGRHRAMRRVAPRGTPRRPGHSALDNAKLEQTSGRASPDRAMALSS
jgi:hypothetical protein